MPTDASHRSRPTTVNAQNDTAFLQSVLEASGEIHVFPFTFQGRDFELQYRNLGWIDKNFCTSSAQQWIPTKNPDTGADEVIATFRFDVYKRLALRKMIVSFPMKLTDTVLNNLPDEIGQQLDTIIPNPLEILQNVDNAKK